MCRSNRLCTDCLKQWGSNCPICKVSVCIREFYLVVKFYRMLYEKIYPIGGKYIYGTQDDWVCYTSILLNKFNDQTELIEIFE